MDRPSADVLAVPPDPERADIVLLEASCASSDPEAPACAAPGGCHPGADMPSVRPPVSGAESNEQPTLAIIQQPITRFD
jgi:hypothetical protein